jgi:hypothetical protein
MRQLSELEPCVPETPRPFLEWFHTFQAVQSSVAIVCQLLFASLVYRHAELQSRSFVLLLTLALSDLLFSAVLLTAGSAAPLATRAPVAGCADCAFTAWWYSFTLFVSIASYATIAFERYRFLCFQSRERVGARALFAVWAGLCALSALIVTVPFMSLERPYKATPSGAYCLYDWTEPRVSVPFLIYMVGLLGLIAYLYLNVVRVIFRVRRAKLEHLESTDGLDARRAAEDERDEQLLVAKKMLLLTVFYIACWVPSVVMILLQMARLPAGDDPRIDPLAACCVTLNASTAQLCNYALFKNLRDAVRRDCRRLRAWLGLRSGAAPPDSPTLQRSLSEMPQFSPSSRGSSPNVLHRLRSLKRWGSSASSACASTNRLETGTKGAKSLTVPPAGVSIVPPTTGSGQPEVEVVVARTATKLPRMEARATPASASAALSLQVSTPDEADDADGLNTKPVTHTPTEHSKPL